MSPRIGIVTRMYCVLMCVVLVCQARVPMDNMLKSKLLAALGEKIKASGASPMSGSANHIQPELPSAKRKAEATSGDGKRKRAITPDTSGTTNGKGTTTDIATASPSSTPVKSKSSDAQNIDVNININNNINNQESITSATAKPTKTTSKIKLDPKSKLCLQLCSYGPMKACGCVSSNAWA